ncbi:hypothetical protein VT06_15775 [Arsukibacterium sp. MJ3]|uniref:hypothetical protein n=1 Tax=Arsukibacterium sp. MJ3 TaxID=1632859 RepID=UPI0006273CCF|nr:hypothetical protein [Arsukibacterium sp. MJ3]KKO47665.1 hypothetical protein VT06_15775 [Arsukibacterium sp. MJ3]
MTAVLLPAAPTDLPEPFQQAQALNLSGQSQSLDDAITAINIAITATAPVTAYLGSVSTPALFWFAAKHVSPMAQLWCYQPNQQWQELLSLDKLKQTVPSAPTATAPAPKQELLDTVFRFHAWGKAEAERILLEAKEQFAAQPEAIILLEKMARQGLHAEQLGQALQKKWQAGEDETVIKAWLSKLDNQPGKIKRYLQITLKKLIDYKQKQQQKFTERSSFTLTLPQYSLIGSLHQHNLRALPPSPEWTLFIDETGSSFDQSALELNLSDKQLGKIVALALPANTTLPPLEQACHAVTLPHEQVQQLLAHVLSSNSGVFGATVHDLTTYSWIGAIAKLTRWALLMLPIAGSARVKIVVEQRAPYADTRQLNAFCDTLENELKLLAPTRFAQLHLSIEIMQKDNRYNGYVDAIANIWGSPDPIKRKMLNRTGWRNHCLLENSDLDSIERFYQRVSYQDTLSPTDWFELCSLAAQEPEHSLLHFLSAQHQQKAREDLVLWQHYLKEAQYRAATKNFTPASLRQALTWLQVANNQQNLPPALELQQRALQLAADNHFGQADAENAKTILKMAKQLRDEIPAEACEAALRVATSATHFMDFSTAVPYLQNWLQQPLAVPGLLNHGKLHSSLGQLAAFRQDYVVAQQYFTAAVSTFEKLSEQTQVQKDITQTRTYQVLAWLDEGNPKAEQAVIAILALGETPHSSEHFIKLARSGDSQRFGQYLLLRWLIANPGRQAERTSYLQRADNWQTGEGHPWMLINAYRAWLLANNAQPDMAKGYLQHAIDDCVAAGSTLLTWMGHVLHALGQSLGLNCSIEPAPSWPAYLPSAQLPKLAAANQHHQLGLLQQLLPFNFH